MKQYEIYAPYIYWKFAGVVNAPTEEEALDKAWDELEIEDDDILCYQCEQNMTEHPVLYDQTGLYAVCLGEEI